MRKINLIGFVIVAFSIFAIAADDDGGATIERFMNGVNIPPPPIETQIYGGPDGETYLGDITFDEDGNPIYPDGVNPSDFADFTYSDFAVLFRMEANLEQINTALRLLQDALADFKQCECDHTQDEGGEGCNCDLSIYARSADLETRIGQVKKLFDEYYTKSVSDKRFALKSAFDELEIKYNRSVSFYDRIIHQYELDITNIQDNALFKTNGVNVTCKIVSEIESLPDGSGIVIGSHRHKYESGRYMAQGDEIPEKTIYFPEVDGITGEVSVDIYNPEVGKINFDRNTMYVTNGLIKVKSNSNKTLNIGSDFNGSFRMITSISINGNVLSYDEAQVNVYNGIIMDVNNGIDTKSINLPNNTNCGEDCDCRQIPNFCSGVEK